MTGRIERLWRNQRDVTPRHLQSPHVKERLNEMTYWERVVESFDLDNHFKAQQADAWEGWEKAGKKLCGKCNIAFATEQPKHAYQQ